jgi:hypothetical protein
VKAEFLNDPWLVRRLPALLRSAGFQLRGSRSHGYLQTDQPEYMLTLVDRGADALASSGRIGPELCVALKAEAQRRAEVDEFFGSSVLRASSPGSRADAARAWRQAAVRRRWARWSTAVMTSETHGRFKRWFWRPPRSGSAGWSSSPSSSP